MQIYLQAYNNKDQVLINNPIFIYQGKFDKETSELFFAVATREVSANTQLSITTESDPAFIERYKKEYGKTLPLLPQGAYSLPESIRIPSGKSISDKMLALTWKDPSVLKDKNATYLLVVSIKNIDNKDASLTSNRNTIFIEVKFNETSLSFKTKSGETSEIVHFNKAGNNVIINGTNPILIASLNNAINNDLPIKISVDNSLISTYNSTNGTQFQALPENTYTLSSTSINIPKGATKSNELEIQFTNAMSQIDARKQYLLPIKSTAQSGITTNNDIVYLKIDITINNIIFGKPVTGNTIDQSNWSVNATSEYDIYIASLMLDGDYDTGWVSNSEDNTSVTLDLGSNHNLTGLSFTPTYLYGFYEIYPSNITIYTSNDGTNWTRQGSVENIISPGGSPQNPYIGWISFTEPVNARYIKLGDMRDFVGIGELKAFE
ncbi:BT_3987 domain-containing protein [Elizabethkingia meningoseptica]|uniref:BT_3987 domain-containing protein n=1 Tax=Elizabethkingia meningoseptica TaxID=238 RepID=UPI0023AEA387|nr:DUF1735 domain-containing protein [Elizabethkingia meningoseptica]